MLAFAITLFTSCGDDIYQEVVESYWKVIPVSVPADDWVLYTDKETGLNAFYMVDIDVPELTQELYDGGNVNAYMYYTDPVTGKEVQTSLFYGIPLENNSEIWTEYYSFDFMPGSVAFYLRYNDLAAIPPASSKFRIVLTY